jgi:hypothetical protein
MTGTGTTLLERELTTAPAQPVARRRVRALALAAAVLVFAAALGFAILAAGPDSTVVPADPAPNPTQGKIDTGATENEPSRDQRPAGPTVPSVLVPDEAPRDPAPAESALDPWPGNRSELDDHETGPRSVTPRTNDGSGPRSIRNGSESPFDVDREPIDQDDGARAR